MKNETFETTTTVSSLHKEQTLEDKPELSMIISDVALSDKQSEILIRTCKYLNLLVAIVAMVYFAQADLMNVALQYAQVSFLSAVVICLDSSSPFNQNIYLVIVFLLAVAWATLVFIGVRSGYPVQNYVVGGFSAFFNFGGIIYCVYIISRISRRKEYKCVEVDLLLYLAALNAICFFSDNNHFNDNLHLILDLRTMLLLYSGLYQPKNKMKLLRLPRFLIVIIGMIGAFLLFSSETPETDILGNIIYILVGMILFYEGYRAWQRFAVLS